MFGCNNRYLTCVVHVMSTYLPHHGQLHVFSISAVYTNSLYRLPVHTDPFSSCHLPFSLSLFLFIIRSLSRRCCGRWCVRHHLMLIIISLLCESRMCPTNRRLADVENYPKHAAIAQAKQCQQFPWPHGGRVHIAK